MSQGAKFTDNKFESLSISGTNLLLKISSELSGNSTFLADPVYCLETVVKGTAMSGTIRALIKS